MPHASVLNVDMHIHSHFSADGNMSPEDIVERAKKERLDAIAVTDHNSIRGGQEVRKISGGLIVFVGSEIKTDQGEIIGLNLKKDVPSDLSLLQACKAVKKQNGFLIVPHPFDRFRRGIGDGMNSITDYIDAVEIFNARTMMGNFNRQAAEFAEKRRLPFVAGSDAHFGPEIGSVRMLVECKRNADEILKAVIEGKVVIKGRKTGIVPHWKTFVKNMSRKL